jgi:hypothetical protein
VSLVNVPVSTVDVLSPDKVGEGISTRGRARMVPLVPVGNGTVLPCIWKSHYQVDVDLPDGTKGRGYEALLLVSRKPLMTLRAEVVAEAWDSFARGPVEE